MVLVQADLPACHALHYLQMAAEKICKAHLHAIGQPANSSHAVVRKHLPTLARVLGATRALSGSRLKELKRLAYEIEMLAPALISEGSRPENPEYPWQNRDGTVVCPADYDFPLGRERGLASLIKLIEQAAQRYSQEPSSLEDKA